MVCIGLNFSHEVIVLYLIFWRHADPCPQLLLSSTHSIFTAFEWLVFRSSSEVTTDEFVHCKCQTCVSSVIYLFIWKELNCTKFMEEVLFDAYMRFHRPHYFVRQWLSTFLPNEANHRNSFLIDLLECVFTHECPHTCRQPLLLQLCFLEKLK